jgi:hypothetical protein
MAQAANQHTPIEWILPDLLEYLTLEPFGYSINRALREMSQAIATGKLPLKREYYVNGKFHTDRLDPFHFHLKYALELDRGTAMVRVVKRGWSPGETSFHYAVAEQDALALWPPRPPASLPALGLRLEDKAEQSLQKPLTSKEWLKNEIDRRKKLGDIPKGITEFSEQIHSQMKKATRDGVVNRLLKLRTIETYLRTTTNLFPKRRRSPKS